MQFVSPDIVADSAGLTLWVQAVGFVIGLAVWLSGWIGHRFWIVLFTTLVGGVLGLQSGPAYQMQPLVAGLLLAIAAGMLALALVRLLAFACGGLATLFLVHALAPASWHEPLAFFLIGGLVGILLFRFWTMLLTSMAGTLVMAYALLGMLGRLGKVDAVHFAEHKTATLNGLCIGAAVLGLVVQYLIDRKVEQWKKMNEQIHRPLTDEEFLRICAQQGLLDPKKHPLRKAG